MTRFIFSKTVLAPRDKIFSYSIDVENFHKIMPAQFKNLEILEKKDNEIMVKENLRFLGISSKIIARHEIMHPDTHKITILGGPAKGTVFLEHYQLIESGTRITIRVDFNLVWPYKILLPFVRHLIKRNMHQTFEDFVGAMVLLTSKD